tara:strand:+ start:560 stop:751 length:192 start_codon:yes stop_codon:yes gene_type:complete
MSLKLSDQAVASLLVTLQKCLAEQTDITELLNAWNLSENNGEIFVDNPPAVKMNPEDFNDTNE